jgi:tripartite-type tricarboxylate transporter receptor subunit TctC
VGERGSRTFQQCLIAVLTFRAQPPVRIWEKTVMRIFISAVAVCATLASIGIAAAQAYPTRPITLIVPYPPGGSTDPAGRIMAERMRVSLGQPMVIENVAGANGGIGTGRVARATGDG